MASFKPMIGTRAKPTCKVLDMWSPKCRGDLRSAICNGQWPQARLYQTGLAEVTACRQCKSAAGTLLHRQACTATARHRGSPDPPPEARAAWAVLSKRQREILTTRGLLAEYDLSRFPHLGTNSFGVERCPVCVRLGVQRKLFSQLRGSRSLTRGRNSNSKVNFGC